MLSNNKELIEIKDEKILELLRYEHKREILGNKSNTPTIVGTLIQRRPNQDVFERKLKMMRTSVYGMLSVC